MLSLDSLTQATFAPVVGQRFKITAGDASAELELVEAKVLSGTRPGASRDPFSLLFRGAQGLRASQGIFLFTNETLGEVEMFITQLSDGPAGSTFEAVFT